MKIKTNQYTFREWWLEKERSKTEARKKAGAIGGKAGGRKGGLKGSQQDKRYAGIKSAIATGRTVLTPEVAIETKKLLEAGNLDRKEYLKLMKRKERFIKRGMWNFD